MQFPIRFNNRPARTPKPPRPRKRNRRWRHYTLMPFSSDRINADGRLMRRCSCNIDHPVGHLLPYATEFPSVWHHDGCCGCCKKWEKMDSNFKMPLVNAADFPTPGVTNTIEDLP